MSTVAFSSTGTLDSSSDDNLQTNMLFTGLVTIVNSEVATITHGSDPDYRRMVTVLDSNGDDAEVVGPNVTNIRRASATTTEITFGAGAAGTYRISLRI